jgi:3-phenylpropionate/trans-cinnamate dioxygenase ferredoxin subunit
VSGEKFVVARVEEIPEGERKLLKAGDRELAVFHLDGEFFALLNRCPHQGGPLCHGELVRPITSDRPGHYSVDAGRRLIACPWHGWEFDLHTGRSFFDPARLKARRFPVEVEGGKEILEGPYRAPLLPVEIEDDYVVVTIPSRRPARAGEGAAR